MSQRWKQRCCEHSDVCHEAVILGLSDSRCISHSEWNLQLGVFAAHLLNE